MAYTYDRILNGTGIDDAETRICPSSDDLGHEGLIENGGPGSLWFQSMPQSGDAASGASRWFWL